MRKPTEFNLNIIVVVMLLCGTVKVVHLLSVERYKIFIVPPFEHAKEELYTHHTHLRSHTLTLIFYNFKTLLW